MGCRSYGVNTILVGLHRVGVVGLKGALQKAAESGFTDRESIVDLLIETLAKDNYVPDPQLEAFRVSIWREYLRFTGEDFSEFFSEIDVTVCADTGDERDRFVGILESVLAEFELKPVIRYDAARGDGPNPQLIINDEAIVRGTVGRRNFKTALRKSITDW